MAVSGESSAYVCDAAGVEGGPFLILRGQTSDPQKAPRFAGSLLKQKRLLQVLSRRSSLAYPGRVSAEGWRPALGRDVKIHTAPAALGSDTQA